MTWIVHATHSERFDAAGGGVSAAKDAAASRAAPSRTDAIPVRALGNIPMRACEPESATGDSRATAA